MKKNNTKLVFATYTFFFLISHICYGAEQPPRQTTIVVDTDAELINTYAHMGNMVSQRLCIAAHYHKKVKFSIAALDVTLKQRINILTPHEFGNIYAESYYDHLETFFPEDLIRLQGMPDSFQELVNKRKIAALISGYVQHIWPFTLLTGHTLPYSYNAPILPIEASEAFLEGTSIPYTTICNNDSLLQARTENILKDCNTIHPLFEQPYLVDYIAAYTAQHLATTIPAYAINAHPFKNKSQDQGIIAIPHPIIHWEWQTAQKIVELTVAKNHSLFKLATAYFDAYQGSIRPTNPLQIYTRHELMSTETLSLPFSFHGSWRGGIPGLVIIETKNSLPAETELIHRHMDIAIQIHAQDPKHGLQNYIQALTQRNLKKKKSSETEDQRG